MNFKFKKNFNVITLLGIALTISAILNVYLFNKKQQPLIPTYKVIGIIDGDTFVIEGKHKVRLRHTQAPEMGNCGSEEAKNLLTKLIDNKEVIFENEIPDPWGRKMAMVFVEGLNINLEMVKSGTSRYYHDVTPYEEAMKKAGQDAEANKLGIFAKCESITPPDPKCAIKGNIRRGREQNKYYLPGGVCPQYPFAKVSLDLGEKWFCTEAEAKAAGYSKAENCK